MEYKLLREILALPHSSPEPPQASHSFCPSQSHAGQSSLILPSPLHSGLRRVIPASRTVPSLMPLSQSISIVRVPSQSPPQSVLPLPSQSLRFIGTTMRYASRFGVLSRRSFSIDPSQLDNAFPYSINFSGFLSFFIAIFSS